MSERDDADSDLDEARTAPIAMRLQELTGFLEDLIDDPTPLSLVPDGSTLEIRRVLIGGQRFRLTAYRPMDSDAAWSARVTSHLGPETPESGLETSAETAPRYAEAWRLSAVSDIIATGVTHQAALDALAEKLSEGSATAKRIAPETLHR